MRFFRKAFGGVPSPVRRPGLFLEELESRVVPAVITGNAWPDPQLITLSFMPDGTLVSSGTGGSYTSDLFAKLNSHKGWTTQSWENALISAAQVWAQYANINFSVVSDNGTPSGQGSYQQGDPGMGDIRFGAISLGAGYLGMGYQPPPANNYSIAGDIDLNDQQNYNIGSTYDLETVAMHEIGHALGLDHTTVPGAVMWPYYSGTHTGLSNDDISGIQAIYGARAPDVYNQGGASDNSFATAANITPLIDPSALTAQAANLDITSAGASEYYTLTAPAGSGPLQLSVQSSGLSLLRPVVTVYAADQTTVLASASGAGSYNGATLTVTVPNVSPGEQFYIKVSGADKTAFGTGDYALSLSLNPGLLGTGIQAVSAFRDAAEHAAARRRRSPGRGRRGAPDGAAGHAHRHAPRSGFPDSRALAEPRRGRPQLAGGRGRGGLGTTGRRPRRAGRHGRNLDDRERGRGRNGVRAGVRPARRGRGSSPLAGGGRRDLRRPDLAGRDPRRLAQGRVGLVPGGDSGRRAGRTAGSGRRQGRRSRGGAAPGAAERRPGRRGEKPQNGCSRPK